MQTKLVSKEAKRLIERAETKDTCISPIFVKIIFLSVFSLFDSFLLILVLENPNALVQAKILKIFMRKALRIERANFGVQQLPLFNLLELEELDWQVFLSRLEGKRGLDTRVPVNLHSSKCS